MKATRFLISGVVQGVGYRFFAVRAAAGLGIRGFARNLPDGRVEVVAQGPPEALRRFEDQLRAGPRGAAVDQVESSATELDPDVALFEVRF
ncbi:MAG: acylphosphatase [Acidobacteria bacterium]|nr:MAG: acylphosphatase [Acidobacteriota bacterium]